MAQLPPQRTTESSKAYAAFAEYCLLGDGRSIAKVSQACSKSIPLLNRWSGQHDWVERAKTYDQAVAQERADGALARYKDELRDHQDRYGTAGKALYQAAARLLQRLAREVETLDLAPSSLDTVARALTLAADLEAHSLGFEVILQGRRDDK